MQNKPYCAAVIVAAGQGKRMNMGCSKQFLKIGNYEIIVQTLLRFQRCTGIDEMVVVTGREDIGFVEKGLVYRYGITKVKSVVAGGNERQHSVANGIQAVSGETQLIAVHDGARPFVRTNDILKAIAAAEKSGAAAIGVKVKDTLKMADEYGNIVKTIDRNRMWSIQTPQVFRKDILRQAFSKAEEDGFLGTDECMLAERIGVSVALVEGHYDNIKITTKEDLYMGEAILKKQREAGL